MTKVSPLNLTRVKELYGEEAIPELLQMSVQEIRELLEQIATGIKEENPKLVAAAAHQLKGLAATMTISEVETFSLKIEENVKKNQWQDAQKNALDLQSAFSSFERFVQTVLS